MEFTGVRHLFVNGLPGAPVVGSEFSVEHLREQPLPEAAGDLRPPPVRWQANPSWHLWRFAATTGGYRISNSRYGGGRSAQPSGFSSTALRWLNVSME